MIEPKIEIPIPAGGKVDDLISREWLVTNGLGGYASGTIPGINTRRHHGLFVPNLPAPRGRTMLLPYLFEQIICDNQSFALSRLEIDQSSGQDPLDPGLKTFALEWQMPVWTFEFNGSRLEKRVFMPYGNNTVCVSYRHLSGAPIRLNLRPYCACRKHDSPLGYAHSWSFPVKFQDERYELAAFDGAPVMRVTARPFRGNFIAEKNIIKNVFYRTEAYRGLDHMENLFSPGYFSLELTNNETLYFLVSTESWEVLEENPQGLLEGEISRRKKLLSQADEETHPVTAQLVLAADQFIILPRTRNEKDSMLEPSEQVRTIIAGYHWFTDWGRDTMISLEGLTLCTGRQSEARAILQTFGHYVRNGLLPNHFPEGERYAIYNTVDATFWYFHALDRYIQLTGDHQILELLYPTLQSIIDHHVQGTDFGIRMDPVDSLISAAAEGYQLTWMDAKVDEWVVTPRRGKPVEIQALWFNALKLMEVWGGNLHKPVDRYRELSEKVSQSFNARFWFEKGGYLYDVVDTPRGSDSTLRPNQIMALSLRFAVLDPKFWKSVVDVVEKRLRTPVGLRTLDPDDKNYHARYEGNRWNRDAAYHQGMVWAWLIGPFWDAWKKVYPDSGRSTEFFMSFERHLKEGGLGTISEIFDGDDPYLPRGCIAQAWSVAEVLRCLQELNRRSAP